MVSNSRLSCVPESNSVIWNSDLLVVVSVVLIQHYKWWVCSQARLKESVEFTAVFEIVYGDSGILDLGSW